MLLICWRIFELQWLKKYALYFWNLTLNNLKVFCYAWQKKWFCFLLYYFSLSLIRLDFKILSLTESYDSLVYFYVFVFISPYWGEPRSLKSVGPVIFSFGWAHSYVCECVCVFVYVGYWSGLYTYVYSLNVLHYHPQARSSFCCWTLIWEKYICMYLCYVSVWISNWWIVNVIMIYDKIYWIAQVLYPWEGSTFRRTAVKFFMKTWIIKLDISCPYLIKPMTQIWFRFKFDLNLNSKFKLKIIWYKIFLRFYLFKFKFKI